jgi:hypothetical protein
MQLKKTLASSGLVIAMASGGVLMFPSDALATTPVVKLEKVCNTTTGLWDLKTTVSGDAAYPNETATIKNQTLATTEANGSASPNSLVGKTVKNTSTVSGYSYGLAANTTFTQKVGVQWTNHKTGDLVYNQATVKTDGSCTKTPPPPTQVTVPSVPVVDACGPNNAVFGPVPPGNYTYVVNADGSITFTANKGYTFPNGSTTASLPRPTDSNVPCPPTQLTVTAPKSADKCGPKGNPTKFDRFYVPSQAGVGFTRDGKLVSPGWSKTGGARSVVLTAFATDPATTALTGRTVWKFKYDRKVCHKPKHPGHGGVLRQQVTNKAAGATSPFARLERSLQ